MTRNQKFEQIEQTVEQTAVIQNKEKTFFVSVNHNTNKRNFIRICRFNSIQHQINFTSFFTSSTFNVNINTLEDILQVYRQLSHARFFSTFVQFSLTEVIERINITASLKSAIQLYRFRTSSLKFKFIIRYN